MRSVEAEGASIDDAITSALELLKVDRDRVEIEILDNATKGLLGFGGKRARVRATVRSPLAVGEDSPSLGDHVSRETSAPSRPEPAGDPLAIVTSTLGRILSELGIQATPSVAGPEDGIWTVSVIGSDTGIVIGRHGQTLDAIEYVLNRILARSGVQSSKIVLDVEGYRERRQEALEDAARRLAAQVKQTGRPASLSPMSPRDRRIVHVALSDDQGVVTRSQGEGSYRRVIIAPATGASRTSAS